MTIWLLALLLMAGAASVGYAQGAIRAAFSFVGILVGVWLAFPLAKLTRLALPPLGVDNVILLWALGPIVAFLLVLLLFKVAGALAHKKVDVYYKYKAGDLRLALFLRLNARIGACVGLMNGAAYTLLLARVIFPVSYFTTQVYTSDQDSWAIRMVNRLGRDLQTTGLARAVRAADPVPPIWYDGSDLIGLVYHNPLTHGRIGLYPPFLLLGEKPEYQRLGDDDFFKLFMDQQPFGAIANDDRVKNLWNNQDNFKNLWAMLEPDLADLEAYIRTGKSAKYDAEPILGRWYFDVNGSLVSLRRTKQNLTSAQIKLVRLLYPQLAKAVMVATPDGKFIIRGLAKFAAAPKTAGAAGPAATMPMETPMTAGGVANDRLRGFRSRTGLGPRVAPTPMAPVATTPAGTVLTPAGLISVENYDLQGQWRRGSSGYLLSAGNEQLDATVEGLKLTIPREPTPLVFEKDTP